MVAVEVEGVALLLAEAVCFPVALELADAPSDPSSEADAEAEAEAVADAAPQAEDDVV